MKIPLSAPLLVLLTQSTNALAGRRRLDSCGVVNNNYGSGSNLDDERGNSAIDVDQGNSANCQVLCDSAAGLELYVGYGEPGQVNKGNAEGSNTAASCGTTVSATNSNGEKGFEFIVVATSYTNLRVACGCPTDDQTGGGGCFSSTDTVQVLNRGETAMKDLNVGDKVLTGRGTYEPIYSFGHYHETQVADFVKLETNQEEALTLTASHMIYANGDKSNPIRADQVQVGDQLSSGTVQKVSTIAKQGLFMPLTTSGKVLVNNVEASAYISMSDYAPIQQHPFLKFWLSEHNLVHLWLSPYRMYCLGVRSNYCPVSVKNADGEEGVMKYLLLGKKMALFGLDQPFVVQALVGFPLFGTLLVFSAVEMVTGPVLAPVALLLVVVAILKSRRRQQKQKLL